MNRPTVQVVVPVFNGGSPLIHTLRSLAEQTCKDAQFLIVDNGSNDGSSNVIDSFLEDKSSERWKLFRYPHPTGMTENWNRALEHTTSPFVKLLPCDDLLSPSCLESELMVLEKNPDASFSIAQKWLVDAGGQVRHYSMALSEGIVDRSNWKQKLLRNPINRLGEPGAALIRSEYLKATGGFDPAFCYYLDLDMWIRLLDLAPAVYWHGRDYFFRVHSGSATATSASRAAREFGQLYRKHSAPGPFREYGAALASFKASIAGHLRVGYLRWLNA